MNHFVVTEVITEPVATVPAFPAVRVTAPAVVIVPARSPAVPAACEVTSEKLAAAPVVTAAPGIASAYV